MSPAVLASNGDEATFTLDAGGRISRWNAGAEALYGFSAREVVGRHPTMLVPPELDFERDEHVREVLAGRGVQRYETERMRKDGSRVDVAITLSPLRDAGGRIVGASADVRETDGSRHGEPAGVLAASGGASTAHRERSQRRLAEAQERFRIAFLHAPNGIALLSTAPGSEGCFLDANPALGRQLGYAADELVGRCLLDFLHPETEAGEPEALAALLEATEADARAERRFLRGDGRDVWLQIGASVVRDDAGRPLYAVAHLQDVTDARRHEAELRHLADHDGLTGLVNRRCFNARLETALTDAGAFDRRATVLVIDLDDFKSVNDTYGHAVGDELLRRVAGALRSRVRETDVVARLGGDEFGILLPDVTPEQARGVATELLAAVGREATVPTGDGSVRVTASIGISTLDRATRATGEALLSDADTAMYAAKRSGRDRFASSADSDPRAVGAPRGRRLGAGVQVPARGRLELWEQPQLALAAGAPDRIELLARMRGRRGEAIPAGRFLPLMQRFGRAGDLDAWVLEAAVALIARRQAAGLTGDVEINLDASSVTDERFVESIHATLEAASVDPGTVTFAITAAASISDVASARRLMSSLSRLGCRFALDHFGASAGSLRDLKQLPFDVVKIDGELIAELPERRFDQRAVRAISDIARGSGLLTVAEHVSDDATLELLREYGIDYAQGFHVAMPRPAQLTDGLLAAA
ncbi:MAG: diguanylate cyclase/phosphodiesterase (GGDEF & EAL domains) with PAS/PAC sensor(s) [uncultured Solirubrobacteraceae bacterium]|uniref:Diguanylate cyclase/phosphodiesterase (GGDEF & EAL domains) with PAS/PAC sensor(S) n=1 Tax=uncultured Solirubrobacteraceae bacterium TaxID=1162706 RepID=A0A6J4S4J8_9ACTN|nr:MAG: diguanylate cyclase/phosphodiesterase (GGDEF & EAL domains) with PAS/PAC sensor(s) [uncultured Solirubrobacteraceae bacterium]